MVAGISADELATTFPLLYHMAQEGSWPSIQKHGLLSTSALLDLFEVTGEKRIQIESRHRPESVEIFHDIHGHAVIRDQKPMSDSGLLRALQDGLLPENWYRLLNVYVFFWLTNERLRRLAGAKAYRERRQTVLIVDTRMLVDRYSDRIVLSPINSGCTKPFPHKRGAQTFQRMSEYDYAARKGKRDPIVELAVEHSVPDVENLVTEVWEVGAGKDEKLIWKRAK